MKNSTASNRKTGRMIAKNLIILVVLVFVAVLAMWAWFTDKSSATADGIDVNCQVPDGIEIAVVAPGATPTEKDYVDGSIEISADNFSFMENLVLSEVTSDGKTFYKPALIQSNGVAYADTSANWDKAVANENYLSFDLYIRSKSTQKVSLTTKSKFTPLSSVLVGETAGNKSKEGDYSRDCIIGATRFSVVDYNDSTDGELKLLWIPRPDIYFYSSGGSSGVELDVSETDYDGLTYKHNYYEVTDTSKTFKTIYSNSGLDYFKTSKKVVNSDNEEEYVLPSKTEILKLTKIGDDKYYTKCVRCNMWIDGEDTEDRLALVKGKFKIYLDLTIK
ncbi:MAG: hypothetical protein ACI4GX_08450 [Ruminococcus sp.]